MRGHERSNLVLEKFSHSVPVLTKSKSDQLKTQINMQTRGTNSNKEEAVAAANNDGEEDTPPTKVSLTIALNCSHVDWQWSSAPH
jgi:hypothetical protein